MADLSEVDLLGGVSAVGVNVDPALLLFTFDAHQHSLQLTVAVYGHRARLLFEHVLQLHVVNVVLSETLQSVLDGCVLRCLSVGLGFLLERLEEVGSLEDSLVDFTPVLLDGFENLLVLFYGCVQGSFIDMHFLTLWIWLKRSRPRIIEWLQCGFGIDFERGLLGEVVAHVRSFEVRFLVLSLSPVFPGVLGQLLDGLLLRKVPVVARVC